jgi:transposase-like protein
MIAAAWRKHRPKPGTTWRLDEAYMKVGGRMVYRGDAFGA